MHRLSTEEECQACIDLERGSHEDNTCFRSAREASFREFLSNPLKSVLICKVDRRVVGFLGVKQIRNLVAGLTMEVHPRYRRQGIGSALIQSIHEMFHNRANLDYFVVNTIRDSAGVMFRNYGFTEISKSRTYLKQARIP
ncbi:MAG: GNAT family N-acetyltransferase [Pseudobacteriovorax sp.]|nr:GNAT family N-acetyltransferase [Pseudobacteriovorax sp.]